MSYNADSWKDRLVELINVKTRQRVIEVSWETRKLLSAAERIRIANLFNTLAAIFAGDESD